MAAGTSLFSLADPFARAVILPLVISGGTVGLIRLMLGEGRGSNLASAGIGIGFLAAFLAIFGAPDWPAFGMGEKTIWVAALALLVGAAADRFPALEQEILLVLIAWPVFSVLWFLEPTVAGGLSGRRFYEFGILLVGSITLFIRLREEQDNGQSGTIHILWFAVGLGLIGYIKDHIRVSEAGAAVAAASIGYLVWNLPKTRYPFGFTALIASSSAIVGLCAILIANGTVLPLWPLLILLFASDIGSRIFRQKRGIMAPLAGGAVPVALAVLLAWIT